MKINIVQTNNITNGLFAYLFKEFNINTVNRIVKASASSKYPTRGSPDVVINPYIIKDDESMYWISQNNQSSYFLLSFQNHIFALDSYTMLSRDYIDYNTPLEWILEGSNDNANWDLIQHKDRGNELNGTALAYNWTCESKTSFYSYYKFTQVGENYHIHEDENYIFAIGGLELFGTLFEKYITQGYHSNTHISLLFVIIGLLF